MAYELDGYITDAEPAPPRRWPGALAWPAVFAIAFVIYELTNQPALAVIFLCVKFGWEDFRTAAWLVRQDADGRRGLACFFLYVSSGLWKTAITATLMIFGYVLVIIVHRAVGGGGMNLRFIGQQLAGAILTTLAGIVLSTAGVWVAVLHALANGRKLWLSPAVHQARRIRAWPPPAPLCGRRNSLDLLLWTTLIGVGGPALIIGSAVLTAATVGPVRQGGGNALTFLAVLAGAFLLAGLFARWLVLRVVDRKVVARRPAECWEMLASGGRQPAVDSPTLQQAVIDSPLVQHAVNDGLTPAARQEVI